MSSESEFHSQEHEFSTDTQPPIHDNLPEVLTEKDVTPYEKVRPLDYDYEHLKDLDALSAEELEKKVSAYEALPEHKEFNELHLNFNQLDILIEEFSNSEEGKNNSDLCNQLVQIVNDIKLCASNYYKKVMAFDRTKINSFRMETFEFQDSMKEADQSRRFAHNSLIDTVIKLAKLCYKTIPESTGYRFKRAQLFDQHLILDLRSENQNLHKPAREKIANWAFINERGIHIQKSVERARELIKQKTAKGEPQAV